MDDTKPNTHTELVDLVTSMNPDGAVTMLFRKEEEGITVDVSMFAFNEEAMAQELGQAGFEAMLHSFVLFTIRTLGVQEAAIAFGEAFSDYMANKDMYQIAETTTH